MTLSVRFRIILVVLCATLTILGRIPVGSFTARNYANSSRGSRGTSRSGGPRQPRQTSKATSAVNRLSPSTGNVTDRQNLGLDRLPVAFEANQGQWPASVNFGVRRGGSMGFIETGGTLMISGPSLASVQSTPALLAKSVASRFEMKIAGASTGAKAVGDDRLPGVTNYITGNDQARWRGGIPSFRRAMYRGIYSGIDLTYYANDKGIEYDFTVAPGYSPSIIKLSLSGGGPVRLTDGGDLQFENDGGDIALPKPVCYQESGNKRQHVDGHYVLAQDGQVGFQVGSYDMTKPLVIDPVVDYSTYLGGEQYAQGNGIAVDDDGNAYVVGAARGGFPTTVGRPQPPNEDAFSSNSNDVFVTKLNPEGTALVYSTVIAGGQDDSALSIAVDQSGEAYIAGLTYSSDFPMTAGAFQTRLGTTGGNAFVAKLSPDGLSLIYSTYLGGSGNDAANAISIDDRGNAYLAGTTTSMNFPVTPGVFQPVAGDMPSASASPDQTGDGFVAKLNAAGSTLIYSSYLGGAGADTCNGISVDQDGDAFVTGSTNSQNFPVTPNAFQTSLGGGPAEFGNEALDCFITKVNPSATALVYSTFLGGDRQDSGNAIAVDDQGKAYVVGGTTSSQFPTTPGAIRTGGQGLFTASTGASTDSWSAIDTGLQDSLVTGVAFDQSTSPSTTYASTPEGVFKSIDQGGHWVEIDGNRASLGGNAAAFSPGPPPTIYAGAFRSTDGGTTWQPLNFGPAFQDDVNAFAVDAVTPSTVYAAATTSLFKSTDGGATWLSVLGGGFSAVGIDPRNPAIIYGGSFGEGVQRSTDFGMTWTGNTNAVFRCSAIAIDPGTSDVYAATDVGVLKSTDGTATWTSVHNGLPAAGASSIAFGANGLYAGIDGGIYRSTNRGKTWAADSNGVAGALIASIVADPGQPGRPYTAGTAAGGFVTTLNPQGSGLVYSTLLGGSNSDQGMAIAVDANGNAYIGGQTRSFHFPTTPSTYLSVQSIIPEGSGFITKLSPSGNLLYSSYLGGFHTDSVLGIAVNKSGTAYATGQTTSSDFPVTAGSFQTVLNSFEEGNAFVTRLEASPKLKSRLSIKQTGPSTIVNGQNFQYGITIINGGPDPAFDVIITDDVPALVGVFAAYPMEADQEDRTNITFVIPQVDPGKPVTVDVYGASTNCKKAGTFKVTNVATIAFSSPAAPKAKTSASFTSKIECP
jgi:uncharacterized repeat protein (TIGR01451 family)